MNRFGLITWSGAGLAAGLLGWIIGGWIAGSLLGRTVGAAALVALVFGLLATNAKAAGAITLVTGGVAAAVFVLGTHFVTPLLAFPAAALAMGVAAAFLLGRTRARVVVVAGAPILGLLGLTIGIVAVVVAGLGTDSSRILEQLLAGGGAGFGLLTLAGLRLLGPWLDRSPAIEGAA